MPGPLPRRFLIGGDYKSSQVRRAARDGGERLNSALPADSADTREQFWLNAIEQVRQEREALVVATSKLSDLLGDDKEKLVYGAKDPEAKNRLLIEIGGHLGQISGFCDKKGRNTVKVLTDSVLSSAMTNDLVLVLLVDMLPKIAGIQVDFTRRPFRLLGIDITVFVARFKAIVGR